MPKPRFLKGVVYEIPWTMREAEDCALQEKPLLSRSISETKSPNIFSIEHLLYFDQLEILVSSR